jgi:hypothetical protein
LKVPAALLNGLIVTEKLAVWPDETVRLFEPETATVKSNPIPDKATLTGEAIALELTARVPTAAPLEVG